jgi:SM-20-related protein
MTDASKAAAVQLLPPYTVVQDFLDESTVQALLDYASAHQSDFEPTRVSKKGILPSLRVSVGLRELGEYREILKTKILGLIPRLVEELKVQPFLTSQLEMELVAHGEGAFYKRHIDTQTAKHEKARRIRILSGVYYFYAEPKAFVGGALRLYAIGPGNNFVDIEPKRNSLLVFPSWAPHEVTRIECPSKRFEHSRFAINCWLLRDRMRDS